MLQALGLPHASVLAEGEWRVLVRLEDRERALSELGRYEGENRGWPPREAPTPPFPVGAYALAGYLALLTLFFIWERKDTFGFDWRAAGRSQAAAVLDGEWWRALTALTLHADIEHLLGNLVFGGLFGVILSQTVGAARAWPAILLSGFVGNLANAWIQDPTHASIGASTAVFGALGAQAVVTWRLRDPTRSRWRRWAPLIGGLALLGWLGMGGTLREGSTTRETIEQIDRTLSRVDVLAHITGFVAGGALGFVLALPALRRWRSRRIETALLWSTLGLVALAWSLALS